MTVKNLSQRQQIHKAAGDENRRQRRGGAASGKDGTRNGFTHSPRAWKKPAEETRKWKNTVYAWLRRQTAGRGRRWSSEDRAGVPRSAARRGRRSCGAGGRRGGSLRGGDGAGSAGRRRPPESAGRRARRRTAVPGAAATRRTRRGAGTASGGGGCKTRGARPQGAWPQRMSSLPDPDWTLRSSWGSAQRPQGLTPVVGDT